MLIEIENLVKRYGDFTALNHLNLSVKKGQYIYNDSYLYIACNDGTLGNKLSHSEGSKLCGDVYMLKLAELAKFQ